MVGKLQAIRPGDNPRSGGSEGESGGGPTRLGMCWGNPNRIAVNGDSWHGLRDRARRGCGGAVQLVLIGTWDL